MVVQTRARSRRSARTASSSFRCRAANRGLGKMIRKTGAKMMFLVSPGYLNGDEDHRDSSDYTTMQRKLIRGYEVYRDEVVANDIPAGWSTPGRGSMCRRVRRHRSACPSPACTRGRAQGDRDRYYIRQSWVSTYHVHALRDAARQVAGRPVVGSRRDQKVAETRPPSSRLARSAAFEPHRSHRSRRFAARTVAAPPRTAPASCVASFPSTTPTLAASAISIAAASTAAPCYQLQASTTANLRRWRPSPPDRPPVRELHRVAMNRSPHELLVAKASAPSKRRSPPRAALRPRYNQRCPARR